jgi:hypothetical protein
VKPVRFPLMAVGDLATWAGVLVAVGLGVLSFFTSRDAKNEAAEARAVSDRMAERAQASRIVAWFQHGEGEGGGFESRPVDGGFEVSNVRAIVKNNSDEPVSGVRVEIVQGDGSHSTIFEEWDILPPQGRWFERDPRTLRWRTERPYVHVTFTDAADQRWERGPGSRLSKLPPYS